MGKRAKGEGTIFYSKARGKWVAQLPVGPDGRRHMRTTDTEAEALKLLRQMRTDQEAGRDLSRQAESVKELLDDWLETMKPMIRKPTLTSYRVGCKHITDKIGKVKAQDVTTDMVQRVANALTNDGIGPATVRAALVRLRSAYDLLIPERYSYNPVNWRKLKLRKTTNPERKPLDARQLRLLLLASTDIDDRGGDVRWAAGIWLAGLLGMRRGEILGLCWCDIDFERSELQIRQQRAGGSESLFSPPKTPQSQRTIPIGPQLKALLTGLWKNQQAERRMRGETWKEHGLVLCHEDGRPPMVGMLAKQLDLLSDKLGILHINPHLLRHSVATMLDELGYSETIIGAILGHTAGKSSTRRYTHARDKAMYRAIEAVEGEILGGIQEAEKAAF